MSNDIDETAAGGRKNPDNRIVDATDILTGGDALDLVNVDSGDRAKTYLIDLDLIAAAFSSGQMLGQLNFFGNSGAQGTDGRETLDLLKEIEATGDNTRDPGTFVDDGGSRQRLELFETNDAGEAVASDDLLALILAAIDAQADLDFFETDTGFDIHIGGRWSTDILRFEGETALQLVEDLLPPDNTAPDAMDDVITITAGETLTDVLSLILANDSDPDGDVLSVPFGDVFMNGLADNFADLGFFSLQLDDDRNITSLDLIAEAGVSGTTSFTYEVSDGNGGFDTATVTVIVEAPDPGAELLIDFEDALTTAVIPGGPGQTAFRDGTTYEGFTWNGVSGFELSEALLVIQDWEEEGGEVEAATQNTTWTLTRGGDAFDFISGEFASKRRDGESAAFELDTLFVTGLRNGVETFSQEVALDPAALAFTSFNFTDIDELVFRQDTDPVFPRTLESYAMDDLLFVI